jgi:hypothetical protein
MFAYKEVGDYIDVFHMDTQGYDWDWAHIAPREYYDTLDKCPFDYKLEKLVRLIFKYNGWK